MLTSVYLILHDVRGKAMLQRCRGKKVAGCLGSPRQY